MAHLQSLGNRVVLVSSGAIGAGVAALQLKKRPGTIPEKQATAAIGQPILMEAYEAAFRKQGRTVAQILLTKDDFVNRTRYMNVRNTLRVLFDKGVVPIRAPSGLVWRPSSSGIAPGRFQNNRPQRPSDSPYSWRRTKPPSGNRDAPLHRCF